VVSTMAKVVMSLAIRVVSAVAKVVMVPGNQSGQYRG
jgi:hypothetical protein